MLKKIGTDMRELLTGARAVVRRHRMAFLVGLAVFAAATAVLLPHDASLMQRYTDQTTPLMRRIARRVSRYGNYPYVVPVLSGGFLLAGLSFKRRRWVNVGLACFLAASLSGLTTDVIRASVGRPRPSVHTTDGVYGPHVGSSYFSFPSGHSTVAFATASSITVMCPALGVPLFGGATAVAWSRVYLRAHHPSDVVMGAGIGILFGIAFGLAARRREEESAAAANPG